MIRKPTHVPARDHAAVTFARTTAAAGMTAAKAGGHALRATVCFGFAGLWGFAALAAGLAGSLPTFVGVGLMALGMVWAGRRALRSTALVVRPNSELTIHAAPRERPPTTFLTGLTKRLTVLAVMALVIFGVGKAANAFMGVKTASRAPTFKVANGDAEMQAASARAKATMARFWDSLDRGVAGEKSHSLKVRVPLSGAGGATAEQMWVTEVRRDVPGHYTGRLDNVPEYVKDYRIGQRLSFTGRHGHGLDVRAKRQDRRERDHAAPAGAHAPGQGPRDAGHARAALSSFGPLEIASLPEYAASGPDPEAGKQTFGGFSSAHRRRVMVAI